LHLFLPYNQHHRLHNASINYYRDVQENAVANSFNDDFFAKGITGTRGHKVKLSYKISKIFAAAFAYYATKLYDETKINMLHLDLKAKL